MADTTADLEERVLANSDPHRGGISIRDRLREQIARALEPRAWVALGLCDTLAYKNRRALSLRKAAAALEAIEASGYRLIFPTGSPNLASTELPKLGPQHFEALAELARYRRKGRRYCWRVASMKKLMAHGLVEHEAGSSRYWNITGAGRSVLAARPRNIDPHGKVS